MSETCQVREALEKDAPAISRVIVEALRTSNSQDYSPAVIARVEQSFSPEALLGLMARRQVVVAQLCDKGWFGQHDFTQYTARDCLALHPSGLAKSASLISTFCAFAHASSSSLEIP